MDGIWRIGSNHKMEQLLRNEYIQLSKGHVYRWMVRGRKERFLVLIQTDGGEGDEDFEAYGLMPGRWE